MELICINNKLITLRGENGNLIKHDGTRSGGLIEGEIYNTKGEPFLDEDGLECYYITGKGMFLAIRFTKALPKEIEYKYTAIKTEEPILN